MNLKVTSADAAASLVKNVDILCIGVGGTGHDVTD